MSTITKKFLPIGEERDAEALKDAVEIVYRSTPQGDLKAYCYFPEVEEEDVVPAVVMLHGGQWDSPLLTQFVPNAQYFVGRKMVAIILETRTIQKHQATPLDALDDTRFFMRWLRINREKFGINRNQIAIMAAAGGAWQGLMCDLPTEQKLPFKNGYDCRPNALILVSAIVDTTKRFESKFSQAKIASSVSPHLLVRSLDTPMLFLHGTSEQIVPFEQVEQFCKKMKSCGAKHCELIPFEKADHTFFNYNLHYQNFIHVMDTIDVFLAHIGWMEKVEMDWQ